MNGKSKQEETMRIFAHFVLWYLTIIILFSFVQIVFIKTVDILQPVQFLGIMGLTYWLAFVVTGIYYQIKEEGFKDLTVLITKFVLAGFTVYGFTNVPSALTYSMPVQIPLNFDNSFYLLFIVGLMACIMGLALSILSVKK